MVAYSSVVDIECEGVDFLSITPGIFLGAQPNNHQRIGKDVPKTQRTPEREIPI